MLSLQDALLAAGGTALAIHLIYNRVEPRKLRAHFSFLVVVPMIVIGYFRSLFSSWFIAFLYMYPTFIGTLLSSLVLYRLSFIHPLAKFPGPLVNKVSNLRMSQVATRRKRHIYLRELHDKYGPYVRIGPNTLSIVDVDAVQAVLGSKGLPHSEFHDMFTKDGEVKSLSNETNARKHGLLRRVWNRGFTPTALKGYDEIIVRRVSQLLDRLEQQTGEFDLGKWISYYKFDFMGDVAFGGGFEMMRAGGDHDGLWAIILNAMKAGSVIGHLPWLGAFLKLLTPLAKDGMRLNAFGKERTEIRLRNGSTTHDLFHYLAEEDKPESERPPPERLHRDGVAAIVAAADTTSSIMSGCFYHLLADPKLLERVRAEVDATFSSDEIVMDHSKLSEMPLLNACINETLRVMPALLTGLRRGTRKGSDGVVISGRFIPKNTTVFIPPYCLHHDRRYFSPVPDKFWPDRWLIADKEDSSEKQPEAFAHNVAAFIPFSFGPFNCVGKQLAYREMRIVIASILRKFDLRFADGYDPKRWYEEMYDDITLAKGGLPVVLTKRVD